MFDNLNISTMINIDYIVQNIDVENYKSEIKSFDDENNYTIE